MGDGSFVLREGSAKAGPSTQIGAKNASSFAQDDSSMRDGLEESFGHFFEDGLGGGGGVFCLGDGAADD